MEKGCLFIHFLSFFTFCLLCFMLDSRYKQVIVELKEEIAEKESAQRLYRRSVNEDVSDILTDLEALSTFVQEKANDTMQKAIKEFLNTMSFQEETGLCQKIRKCGTVGLPGKQGPIGPPGPQGNHGLGMFVPEIVNGLFDISANTSDNKTFKCIFFGNPIPKVTWKTHISNTKISNVIDRNNSTVTSLLRVSNITWADRGSIECHGSSLLGKVNTTGRLIVHSPPLIKPFKRLLYTYKGINFKFPPCQAEGYPLPAISWKRGYGVLSPYRNVIHKNGVLEIKSVRVHDEGFYICKVENYLGQKTEITQLEIKPLEFSSKPPYNINTKNYQTILNCSVYAYGGSSEHIQGRWYKLDEMSYNVNYTATTVNNTVLVQANIVREGRYVCEIRNKDEKIEAITIVEFPSVPKGLFIPEIREMALNIEANITDTKTFKCVFFGNPIPKVTWQTHISKTKISNVINKNQNTVTSLLEASNITWEDRGQIECHAKSVLGKANATGDFIVHSPPLMKPLQCLLYTYEGINFKFPSCQAEGYPVPQISWERDYGGLSSDRSFNNQIGVLEIKNICPCDEGVYYCKAKNYLGEKVEVTQLRIKPLVFKNKPPSYVTFKHYVNLNCSVHVYGGSAEQIQGRWYKLDDRNYNVNYTVTTSNNTVLVQANIVREGRYVCEIKHKNEKIETFTFVEFLHLQFDPKSSILSGSEYNALRKIMSGNYSLCWSSTAHGISASKFHTLCDRKGPTISMFRIESKGIIGGYTDSSWGGSSGYRSSSDAFLFHIQYGVINKYPTRRSSRSIYSSSSYGPTFGGGYDLYMSGSTVYVSRYSSYYNLPSSIAGSYSVIAEVFYKV